MVKNVLTICACQHVYPTAIVPQVKFVSIRFVLWVADQKMTVALIKFAPIISVIAFTHMNTNQALDVLIAMNVKQILVTEQPFAKTPQAALDAFVHQAKLAMDSPDVKTQENVQEVTLIVRRMPLAEVANMDSPSALTLATPIHADHKHFAPLKTTRFLATVHSMGSLLVMLTTSKLVARK